MNLFLGKHRPKVWGPRKAKLFGERRNRCHSRRVDKGNSELVESVSTTSGDNSEEVTPVPISNTVVKLLSADDTWWEAAWESRTSPVFINGSMVKRLRHRPFTAVTRVRFSMGSPFNCTSVQFFYVNLSKSRDKYCHKPTVLY